MVKFLRNLFKNLTSLNTSIIFNRIKKYKIGQRIVKHLP